MVYRQMWQSYEVNAIIETFARNRPRCLWASIAEPAGSVGRSSWLWHRRAMSSLPQPPDGTPSQPGQSTPPLREQRPAARPFRRSRDDKKIAGLCGGFAHYFGWDPTLVRLLVVVGAFVSGGTLALAYLVGWFIVPEAPTAIPNVPTPPAGGAGYGQ
jgi:phage shock protein C